MPVNIQMINMLGVNEFFVCETTLVIISIIYTRLADLPIWTTGGECKLSQLQTTIKLNRG